MGQFLQKLIMLWVFLMIPVWSMASQPKLDLANRLLGRWSGQMTYQTFEKVSFSAPQKIRYNQVTETLWSGDLVYTQTEPIQQWLVLKVIPKDKKQLTFVVNLDELKSLKEAAPRANQPLVIKGYMYTLNDVTASILESSKKFRAALTVTEEKAGSLLISLNFNKDNRKYFVSGRIQKK